MDEFFKKNNRIIPVILIGFMVILGISTIFSLNTGKRNNTGKQMETVAEGKPELNGKILGVIKDIDKKINAVSIIDTNGNDEVVLHFNGGTDIRDKYGKVISISQINLGEIVDVSYDRSNNKLIKLQISQGAWEYKGVENFTIKNSERVMKIGESKYRFNDRLVVAENENLISLIDINEKDELTVKGINEEIWSVIVTRGHGYIRLKNYEDFIDGSIEVGYHIILPVVKDMLIVAREGDYKVTLEKGDLKGSKRINVIPDQEMVLDMGEYRKEPEKKGNVDFLIQPYGATLYIDGEEKDYEAPVELLYGNHVVRVSLSGYESYAGMLEVDESSKVVEIILAKEDLKEESSPASDQSSGQKGRDITILPDGTSSERNKGNTSDKKEKEEDAGKAEDNKKDNKSDEKNYDTDHMISIKEPAGAEVYLDGKLKGIVPCSFTKQIGIHTATLRKSGYLTKSYTIEVEDDDRDINYSFPEMTQN